MKVGTIRDVSRVWVVMHGQKAMRNRNEKIATNEAEASRLYRHYESLGQYVDVFTRVTTVEIHVEKISS